MRDQVDGSQYALKVLAEDASDAEVQALVREASALSGLEGLGVPTVVRFGRLGAAGGGRPFLVRALVEGQSLEGVLEQGASFELAAGALVQVASLLTRLHRASLIHGDIKPANIIVDEAGHGTLVDLGLSVPWHEGRPARGLTPGFDAPELRRGAPPSARTDVYALGATLGTVVERFRGALPLAQLAALDEAVRRATEADPAARLPSADELGEALRRATGLPAPTGAGLADAAWPVVVPAGLVARLRGLVDGLRASGQALEIRGRSGSGKTTALRRLAWSLGAEGVPVGWIEARQPGAARAAEVELAGLGEGAVALVDDAGLLDGATAEVIRKAQRAGVRLVVTAGGGVEGVAGPVQPFALPPVDDAAAASLLRRAAPSLNAAVVDRLVKMAEGRPGKLRSLVARLAGEVVVGVADAERLLRPRTSVPDELDPARRAARALDQGRLQEARAALALLPEGADAGVELLRARLFLSQGDVSSVLSLLDAVEPRLSSDEDRRAATLCRARVALRQGAYARAAALARAALAGTSAGASAKPAEAADGRRAAPPNEGVRQGTPAGGDAFVAECLACAGVADSYLGQHDQARSELSRAVAAARRSGDRRVEALALTSLALASQRVDQQPAARDAYEEALEAAEEAGDAAAVATIRLNLASLALAGQSDLAAALSHLEAAVDMGQKSGRAATVRQALLNLASLDLQLGRLARAQSSLEALAAQRAELSDGLAAQLLGLEAELWTRSGRPGATEGYERCAEAYERLGRTEDAAEARIEAVMVSCRSDDADPDALGRSLDRAALALGAGTTHQAPLRLAQALVAQRRGDEASARKALGEALAAAREAGQSGWVERVLEVRARLERDAGRMLAARRDAEEALALLEEVASRLPRDLREVYWSDPRRRSIQALASEGVTGARPPTLLAQPSRHLADDRLERILAINRDLAMVRELSPLLDRVLEHAAALVLAERGHVLLVDDQGALGVSASRGLGDDEAHRSFSRSIAEQAIASGEPVVTRSARDDARLSGYASVHLLNLQSVACVPIRSPRGGWIGALYLETRSRAGVLFERELGVLRAFADQAAVAIEAARLIEENARRAEALARANQELASAKDRLRDLLDQKRAQLESTRRDLKDTRAVLRGHFGYQGLVGTSAVMRKLYALIDRVKDADVPVLILGESGTGKEMVARAIHDAGPRRGRPFTGVNCGAIPEHLLESELFGHVKGAFTGADRDRRGLFRESEGGTLLLDEIGEMPTKMQAGLLRVLQERQVRPVGGTREEAIDVRIIAATHRDLEAMVDQNTFRQDLAYRLRVVEIHMPALRDRVEDIPALIDHFLQIFAARYRREKGSVSREALRRLAAYNWPGNVRQLQNVLLNAWVLSETAELGPDAFDLPTARPAAPAAAVAAAAAAAPAEAPRPPPTYADHRAAEKERILHALQHCNWNRVKAAQYLGIPRRTFYRRLHEYGIQ